MAIIKEVSTLHTDIFDAGLNVVSLGRIKSDIVMTIIEKFPEFTDYVAVAVRISVDRKLSYRTMYPLRRSQLFNYIEQGRAWKV